MYGTGRVEAFSDGVIAIAITLLILDVHVPTGTGSLWHQLGSQWPHYVAYAVGFLVIGVMWVNHHGIFRQLRQVDRVTLFLNLLLLMTIATNPFLTALVAQYLGKDPTNASIAMALYSCMSIVVSIFFSAIWLWALNHPELLQPWVDVDAAKRDLWRLRFNLGAVVYWLLLPIAFLSAWLCLVGQALVALYYVGDRLSTEPTAAGEEEPADPS